jgi:glycine/D-amino acid oxidase-like deaminating enzyme
MPSPGLGYTIGLDAPLRPLGEDDLDRTPDPGRTREVAGWARRALPALPGTVVDEQVCTWTDSPDGRFVVDRLGPVVLACGDSGEGFKFSALMGDVLADLAEGRPADDDVAALSATRLAGLPAVADRPPTTIGSH